MLGTIGHFKMCSFVTTQCHRCLRFLGERATGMLIAVNALLQEIWISFTISHLQRNFREFGSMSNWPHNRRPRVWRYVGEKLADNIVIRVPHGGVMVWSDTSYFIDGNLNSQRDRDEILRPIVMPFIRHHHLMFQYDNALPHVARICTRFLEARNVPVLPSPPYSPDMSPIWACLGCPGWTCTTACSSSCQYSAILHRYWVGQLSTGHNQQPDQQYFKGYGSRCIRQIEVTPDTEWFSDPCPYFFLRHLCILSHVKSIG